MARAPRVGLAKPLRTLFDSQETGAPLEPQQQVSNPVPPIDLEIRVLTPWGRGRDAIDFVLNSPSGVVGFHHESVSGKPVHSPEKFQKQLFEQLEGLSRGRDVDYGEIASSDISQELITLGHNLYENLFPREMKSLYREIADKVETLLITSDEPWIPWEIVRPAELEDDDFLCMKFQMSRWLTGDVSLASHRRVGHLLYIESGDDDDLPEAGLERQWLQELADSTPGMTGSFPPLTASRDLGALLEKGGFDLLHFAGHGEYNEEQPGETKIKLAEGPLRVRHLSPAAEKKLRQERPLVFFNACQVGRLDHSLSDLDGWAPRWVRRCGCSAFLAPFWSVRDEAALRFAQLFYAELTQGKTLGQAVFLARHRLREEEPGETDWLAYSLYGHTNGRVFFGDSVADSDPGKTGAPPVPRLETPKRSVEAGRRSPGSLQQLPPERIRLTTRKPPQRGPEPKPGLSREKIVGIAASVVLAVALGIWSPWNNQPESQPLDSNGTPAGKSTPENTQPDNSPGNQDSHPPEPSVDPVRADVATTTTEPPKPKVPMLSPVPGKVAILVLNGKTRNVDTDVADAIEAALSRSADQLFPTVPRPQDASFVETLLQGDFSSFPDDGRSPWGSEYLLLATASLQNKPVSPHVQGILLTLSARLIATESKTTRIRSTETHTGAGPSSEAALIQAAERCLAQITESLKGEDSDPITR